MATLAQPAPPPTLDAMAPTWDAMPPAQHLVLTGVSWSYYEQTLEQIGDRPIRVTFLDGNLEIMSPLPEHETAKRAIGRLIETLTLELRWPHKSFGSTPFRQEKRAAGTEADESYYFQDIAAVKGMKRFDPAIHRAPDLAIEVDILNPSIPREPVFARLGVPEIWRFNGSRLIIRLLGQDGAYADAPASRIFPFLSMDVFVAFVLRMINEDETEVVRDFRDWIHSRLVQRPKKGTTERK